MACLGRLYRFKFIKDCLPQILIGPYLDPNISLVFTFFRSSKDHTVPISTQGQREDNIDNKLLTWAMTNNLLEELDKQSNHFEVDAGKVNVTF